MKRVLTLLVMTALVGMFATPLEAKGPHKQKGPGGGFSDTGTWTTYDCEEGTVGAAGPEKLWPPNHKFPADPNLFIATADDPDDGVLLETFVNVDDVSGGDGGPNHDPDASPATDSHNDPAGADDDADPETTSDDDTDAASPAEADPAGFDTGETGDPDGEGISTTEHGLRAERSGGGEGRTYRVEWRATFTDNDVDGGYVMQVCGSTGILIDTAVSGTFPPFHICVPHDMRPANRDAECTA